MADLIGTSVATTYNQTTNTYSSANGEWFYPLTAALSGNADTLKITMSTFNTTVNLKLTVRSSAGVLLASGTIAAAGGDSGVRSVAVTPFSVTAGQSYLLGILANTGSPRPMQNTTTNTVKSQSASTYASTQSTLTLPGTDSAVRQYHMWVEGTEALPPSISSVNSGAGITAGSSGNTAALADFSVAPSSGTFGGVALTSFSASTSSASFSMPGYVDGGVYLNPNTSHDLVIGGATLSVALNLPAGHSAVTIASPSDDDDTFLPFHITLTNGFKFIFPKELLDPEGGDTLENWDFRVAANGKVTATPGTRICWRWNNSTGVMTQVNVTVNNAGAVSVSRVLKRELKQSLKRSLRS